MTLIPEQTSAAQAAAEAHLAVVKAQEAMAAATLAKAQAENRLRVLLERTRNSRLEDPQGSPRAITVILDDATLAVTILPASGRGHGFTYTLAQVAS